MPSSGLSLPERDHLFGWFALDGSAAVRPIAAFTSDNLAAVAERHGVLKRAAAHGLKWTSTRFDGELEAQIRNARDARATRDDVLRALNAEGVVPTLLKGAALVPWIGRDPDARTMGDLDLLVDTKEVDASRRALMSLDYTRPPGSLPDWHLRLWHFNTTYVPKDPERLPVEIHHGLHADALGVDIDPDAFRSRTTVVDILGAKARLPHPIDRWIHLATHFTSHVGARCGSPETVRVLAESPHPPARLRWVGDLVDAWASVRGAGIAETVVRIRTCRAEAASADALAMILPMLDPDGYAAAAAVASAIEPPRFDADAVGRRGRVPHDVDTTLGIRPATLRLWLRWVSGSGRGLRPLPRVGHALSVLGRTATAALAFPFAYVLRSRKTDSPTAARDELEHFEALARRRAFERREADARIDADGNIRAVEESAR